MKKSTFMLGLAFIFLSGVLLFMALQQDDNEANTSLAKRFVQKEGNYEIFFTENLPAFQPLNLYKVRFKMRDSGGQVLKNYDVVHEKLLHVIVVRDDVQYFQHLHPEYDLAEGEFSLDISFPSDGTYRLITEFTPPKFEGNPNSLPVTAYEDVKVGKARNVKPVPIAIDENAVRTVKDYTVEYKMPEKIESEEEFSYSVVIKKNDRAVANMGMYLGALAHAIFVDSETLEIVHTHAENSNGSLQEEETAPEIMFTAKLSKKGLYKVFTEFKHEDEVIVSNYTFQVE